MQCSAHVQVTEWRWLSIVQYIFFNPLRAKAHFNIILLWPMVLDDFINQRDEPCPLMS